MKIHVTDLEETCLSLALVDVELESCSMMNKFIKDFDEHRYKGIQSSK